MNRESMTAAVRDLRALAAARRKAKASSVSVGVALDNASAIETLLEYPKVGDGKLSWIPRDQDVLAVLDRHGLRDLIPEPPVRKHGSL